MDEFGHEYLSEKLDKERLKGLFKLSSKKKGKGIHKVKSFKLGDRLAPIHETEEVKEEDSEDGAGTIERGVGDRKPLDASKAEVELTRLEQIEETMIFKREMMA